MTERSVTNFQMQQLQQRLQQAVLDAICPEYPQATPTVLLALSGGLDSMVLLQLLTDLRATAGWPLHAAHVHHGLQSQAGHWAEFCAKQCTVRQVDFQLCRVTLADPQRNIEQQARELRYQALAALMDAETLLLTAHHADDQLETMLLALKRGSGLHGLAGIAARKAFAGGVLLRPLLAFSRAELEQYATWRQLVYVTDPSNQDLSFERNFLRQQILPLLQQRFPAISATAARSSQLLQQSLSYQQQQLETGLAAVLCGDQLDVTALAGYGNPARDLLLRQFLRRYDLHPSAEQTAEFVQCFLQSTPDARPQLQWGDWQLRRYAGLLYLLDATAQQAADRVNAAITALPAETFCDWQHQTFFWSTSAQAPGAGWDSIPLGLSCAASLSVQSGQLNRRFTPAGSRHSKALKDWCKQWKVPPWRRGSMPFIIAGQQNEVIAVPGFASHCTAAQALSWLHFQG